MGWGEGAEHEPVRSRNLEESESNLWNWSPLNGWKCIRNFENATFCERFVFWNGYIRIRKSKVWTKLPKSCPAAPLARTLQYRAWPVCTHQVGHLVAGAVRELAELLQVTNKKISHQHHQWNSLQEKIRGWGGCSLATTRTHLDDHLGDGVGVLLAGHGVLPEVRGDHAQVLDRGHAQAHVIGLVVERHNLQHSTGHQPKYKHDTA